MMRARSAALAAATLFTLGACGEVPYAPRWNIDVFFPIRYPDVPLSLVGVIPPFNVPFTSAADSDAVSDATKEIFGKDIDALRADVIFATPTNVAGNLEISIAANRAFLFSTLPSQAVTVNIPLRATAGDTTRLNVNVGLFKTATTLYTQSRGNIRSGNGSFLAVGANDRLIIGIDLTANVKMSK